MPTVQTGNAGKLDKRLCLLLYLNSDWPADGLGDLELRSGPDGHGEPDVRIPPRGETCVVYSASPLSWHNTAPVAGGRGLERGVLILSYINGTGETVGTTTDRRVNMAAEQGPFLLLNTKHIVSRLHEWFPDAARELVVVTTRADIRPADEAEYARRFRHLEVVTSLAAVSDDALVELARRFGVRRVLSLGEREVLRAARIRAALGLPGQSLASATAYRDKYVMKSTLAAAGIDVAPMRKIEANDELVDFARQVGYPVVVKELDSGGSNGTLVLTDEQALCSLPALPPGSLRLAEAWVEGEFYHVNGLMEGGEVVLGLPSRNLYSDWFSVAFDAPGMSGMLPDEHPLSERLRRSAQRVVAALPAVPDLCAFHLELFHTADDRLVVCEIACRVGGSLIADTHEAVLGVNLHGASLLGQAGRGDQVDIRPSGERLGLVRFPPARGILRALPGSCSLPGVVRYLSCGVVGRAYDGATTLGPYVAEMVFRLAERDTEAELRQVEQWWEDNVVWEHRTNPVPDRWKTSRRPARPLPHSLSS